MKLKKNSIKLKKLKKLLTEKNQVTEQLSMYMILKILEQQEHLVEIFMKVKLLQKKLMKMKQNEQIVLIILLKKQDHKIIIQNKKKKLFLKTCISFLRQKKKFSKPLKVKYF